MADNFVNHALAVHAQGLTHVALAKIATIANTARRKAALAVFARDNLIESPQVSACNIPKLSPLSFRKRVGPAIIGRHSSQTRNFLWSTHTAAMDGGSSFNLTTS
jgi:hypothetical protein